MSTDYTPEELEKMQQELDQQPESSKDKELTREELDLLKQFSGLRKLSQAFAQMNERLQNLDLGSVFNSQNLKRKGLIDFGNPDKSGKPKEKRLRGPGYTRVDPWSKKEREKKKVHRKMEKESRRINMKK